MTESFCHTIINMNRLHHFITLALFFGFGSASNTRIVGGKDADPAAFPYSVLLATDSGRLVCSGSLISQTVVLTSSHCRKGGMTKAHVGRYDTTDPDEEHEIRNITAVHVHPLWDRATLTNDMILLELDEPVVGTKVMQVDKGDTPLLDGQSIVSIGYGVGADEVTLHDKLQVVELEYVPNIDCAGFTGTLPNDDGNLTYVSYGDILNDGLMCTHFSDGIPKDFCYGDSGGPLMIKKSKWREPLPPPTTRSDSVLLEIKPKVYATQSDEDFIQIGIASFGFDCADPNAPGIGQRIGYAWKFIRTIVCRADASNAPKEYMCGDFLDFNQYPGGGACDYATGPFDGQPCKGKSDCNSAIGECCVYDSCTCRIPDGIETFMCVPDLD
eukprot:scaffold2156_cov115-Cylindrotheca_fusiformis.AAC.1